MNGILTSSVVSVSTGHDEYPPKPPYSPCVTYPEYPFVREVLADGMNDAYEGVRAALRLLQLDKNNYGRSEWNPLEYIILPGDTVVLKPNWIRDFRETQSGHDNCLITHGAIIRAVLDYAYIALEGKGRVIIADAPQDDADFDMILKITGLSEIQEFYRRQNGFEVEVYDLRPEKTRTIDGVTVGYDQLPGDPRGYVKVDLGGLSMFAEIEHLCHLVYGSDYDAAEIRRHHTGGVHEYQISRTILEADCVIDLPKLKTHKKTGITVCMKNLVGINGNKNWLPHHRLGTPAQGGDQFSDDGLIHKVERNAMACFRQLFPLLGPIRKITAKPLKAIGQRVFGDTNADTIRSGNWYGNDTTWRMVLDLNRILMYADKDGRIQDSSVRRMLCIVDGIVGGEGNGPLDPTPKPVGAVLAGMNPVAVDLACARLMGFDYKKIPVLLRALEEHSLPLITCGYEDIVCRSSDPKYDGPLGGWNGVGKAFKPHFGWKGHIELTQRHGDTGMKRNGL